MTLRARLLTTVFVTALAFVVLLATTMKIRADVESRQARIQQEQIPRLELGPALEADFAQLKRSYQDAVAAHDADALTRTNELRDHFLSDLDRGRNVFDAALSAELRTAIGAYHEAAFDVSQRMMAGALGDDSTVTAIGAMQQKQARVQDLLNRIAAVDKSELKANFDAAYAAGQAGARTQLGLMLACLVFVLTLSLWNARYVIGSLSKLQHGFARFGEGRLEEPIVLTDNDELGAVAKEANRMAKGLLEASAERERREWVRTGLMELGDELRGELDEREAATRVARLLARRTSAVAAAVYTRDGRTPILRLSGHHALTPGIEASDAAPQITMGEGLIGEAAMKKDIVVIDDLPADFLRVRSGLGDAAPSELVLVPLVLDEAVTGILELVSFKSLTTPARELLESARQTVAIALAVAQSRAATANLLQQTQRQAARLVEQEEELKTTNEELRCQQEELRQTNDELASQRSALEMRNIDLQEVGRRLEQKAGELAMVSTYKSQFLANMSHELRTPLNSMLLLSKLLEDNAEGNLNSKQVEYARTVYGAGRDLLHLINQVLDLAKVEAGKQTVNVETVSLNAIADRLRRTFDVLAKEKTLHFAVELAPGAPAEIQTDSQRLAQILTNLIGNAIKFTTRGEVVLHIRRDGERLAFAVRDTGPGIAPQHQKRIFEPFEQVDGSTQRKHGGTGLGLNIARDFAQLLGGELRLESNVGEGSTFTCFLPLSAAEATAAPRATPAPAPAPAAAELHLLVIEDDPKFAEILGELIRDRGLVHATAPDGASGLALARERHPRGIILDVKLPDMDGWTVMEKLRADPETAHIPVHFMSGVQMSERGLAMGAIGYLLKPATAPELAHMLERLTKSTAPQVGKVLVVEGMDAEAPLVKQLGAIGISARRAHDLREAFAALDEEAYACVVVDRDASETAEHGLLERIEAHAKARGREVPALIVYTSKPLSRSSAEKLDPFGEAVVLKEGASTDRLLDEIRLFVRRLENGLPPRRTPAKPRSADVKLGGKKLLVVDDDMRTVYALSAMLRARGAEVLVAETGRVALSVLNENPDVNAVLMDIMMPEMDGYEATRKIRAQERFTSLPIIALTAKAMKGDEQRCLDAGATDYLSKPIDTPALLTLLQRRVIEGVA